MYIDLKMTDLSIDLCFKKIYFIYVKMRYLITFLTDEMAMIVLLP